MSYPPTDNLPFFQTATYPSAEVAARQLEVVTMQKARCGMDQFTRHDMFKVMLVLAGHNELHYATRSFVIDRPALVFTNRLIPYAWESADVPADQQGYICCFSESFLHAAMRGVSLRDSVLYKVNGNPVYYLDAGQLRYFSDAFERMRRDMASDYAHKDELLRNQLSIIIHEAAQLPPAAAQHLPTNAAERITGLFLSLLEIEFPMTGELREPVLRSARDYADRMAVHVNHLNAKVKEITGRSTTAHINERLLAAAKLLLTHTDWPMADIADRLGFEYTSYFTSFFKKHTATTPLAFRRAPLTVA